MPPEIANILVSFPLDLTDEVFETIAGAGDVRIERIISNGQSTPEGEWYDQSQDEWVLLLAGSAGLLPKGQETILLVEDEPGILQITSQLLGTQGYTLLTAGTPGEAMRLAQEHVGEINLLITDVIMPEMNGKTLANKLQSLNPQLKCIYMSGYTADVIAQHGVLDEGVYFIQKPFSLPSMAAMVREVLDNKSELT
ncbi:MAG: response regulator [Desulfuromonadaceae bacterium]